MDKRALVAENILRQRMNKTVDEVVLGEESYLINSDVLAEIYCDSIIIEQGTLSKTTGLDSAVINRARTKPLLKTAFHLECSTEFRIYQIYRYEKDGTYIDYQTFSSANTELDWNGEKYARIVFKKEGSDDEIREEELGNIVTKFNYGKLYEVLCTVNNIN